MNNTQCFEEPCALVSRAHWPDADSMVAAAQDHTSDAFRYLKAMSVVRVNRRTRVGRDAALAVFLNAVQGNLLGNPRRRLKVRSFFRECYCLYVSLRHVEVSSSAPINISHVSLNRSDSRKL